MDPSHQDQQIFAVLFEPYRRELQAHCYRMMGSVQDAEDMVQETFLRAWRKRELLESLEFLRAWLYKIATNVCLDELKKRPRRAIPATYEEESVDTDIIPPAKAEPIWLEPYPDGFLVTNNFDPEEYFVTKETISMAFMAALHLLPPRQRAILILRDVLDWPAGDVANWLDITVSAVKSALHRARATLANHDTPHETASDTTDMLDHQLLDNYVRAWESADIEGLLRLLKEEATFSMPPIPSWYRGRGVIRSLISKTIFSGQAEGRWKLLPTSANRQIAFGLYRQSETSNIYNAYGIQVLKGDADGIVDITTYRNPSLFPSFNLPIILEC